jgi:hypothetical protein
MLSSDDDIYSSFEELKAKSRVEQIALRRPDGLGIGIKGGCEDGLPIGMVKSNRTVYQPRLLLTSLIYINVNAVVAEVDPNGSSDGKLQVGDVILAVNGVNLYGASCEEAAAIISGNLVVELLVAYDEYLYSMSAVYHSNLISLTLRLRSTVIKFQQYLTYPFLSSALSRSRPDAGVKRRVCVYTIMPCGIGTSGCLTALVHLRAFEVCLCGTVMDACTRPADPVCWRPTTSTLSP